MSGDSTPRNEMRIIDAQPPGIFGRLGGLGEAVVELLVDRELRRKAGSLVVNEAGRRIKGIQEGVASRAGTLQRGLGEGPRQVQSIYARIQQQYQASRHAASLKARRDTPVDVQVGPFLWEDAPQELRSRLWIALLTNPHLIGNLVEEKTLEEEIARSQEARQRAAEACSPSSEGHRSGGHGTPTPGSPKAGAAPSSPGSGWPGWPASPGWVNAEPPNSPQRAETDAERLAHRPQEAATPAVDLTGQTRVALPRAVSTSSSLDSKEAAEEELRGGGGHEPREEEAGGGEDAWEIVQDGSQLNDFRGSLLPPAELQSSGNGAPFTLRQRLLEAVCQVAWPISTVYPEGCRYDTLCQISIGQEEVEEVIERDINRTFPEHPQFSFQQGQQELFRVLKAYSLHDLQVGYCQGMAFVTGLILMYVPEEPAFRLLTRLMDERGANLRQLYLPGLEGLKNYLRMFEWLMDRTLPELREHLEEYGVVPVLYASQWFLTAFSCPFPTAFSCRVVDAMLTENCGHAMIRVGLAVMKACSSDLLQLHDFEDLVTHLKVEPVKWSQQTSRAVLNEAIQGAISDQMLASAAEAIGDGFEGSLSRRTSALKPESSSEVDARKLSLRKIISKKASSDALNRLGVGVESAGEAASGDDAAAAATELEAETGELIMALDAFWVGDAADTEVAEGEKAKPQP